ncbi:hypothetical protein CDAR_186041 [Caerostris darwini]|uniref:Uncharacterized protein n=1 Tax=Caerostris darwini TaxID=1538125 RepID=A0AAV4WUX4_9ARAC|nr:hypothetical protein CDAR_186041 [Caerostris darwini]
MSQCLTQTDWTPASFSPRKGNPSKQLSLSMIGTVKLYSIPPPSFHVCRRNCEINNDDCSLTYSVALPNPFSSDVVSNPPEVI